jgi:hypothetical protein
VVLDNAADDAQVRPLRPGGGGSRTLVTGVRSTLASLEGIRLVRLGPMGEGEARRLLAAVAGEERVAAEPEAAARVVEACGRLPLALRVAGARLAARQQWPVARLADRLAPPERRLEELRFGSLDVRASLRAALDPLEGAARRDCGLLAAAGPALLTPVNTARLLGVSCEEAEELLECLAGAQVLEARGAEGGGWLRYCFTPLMRLAVHDGAAPPAAAPGARRPAEVFARGRGSVAAAGVPPLQPVRRQERVGARAVVCLTPLHQVLDVSRQ